MLTVDQYSYIRTAHRVYGKKIKEIARETEHSKNTVKKVLRGEYSGYKPRVEQPYPVLGPYLKTIEQWLKDDKERPKKQRHTLGIEIRRVQHSGSNLRWLILRPVHRAFSTDHRLGFVLRDSRKPAP